MDLASSCPMSSTSSHRTDDCRPSKKPRDLSNVQCPCDVLLAIMKRAAIGRGNRHRSRRAYRRWQKSRRCRLREMTLIALRFDAVTNETYLVQSLSSANNV